MLENAKAFDLMKHMCFCIISVELESSGKKITEKVE